jgi:hypothetical protein
MRRFALAAIALVAVACIFNPIARAAGGGARQNIHGTVKDALGRAAEQAELVLRTENGQIVARAKSSSGGSFVLRNIPGGIYALMANKSGFKTSVAMV